MTPTTSWKGRTFALLVGIEHYAMPGVDLVGPCNDVFSVAEGWIAAGLVPAENVTIFVEPSATRDASQQAAYLADRGQLASRGVQFPGAPTSPAIDAFWRSQLFAGRPAGSCLLVYWAGHGLTHSNGNRVLLSSDYDQTLPNRVFGRSGDYEFRRHGQTPLPGPLARVTRDSAARGQACRS